MAKKGNLADKGLGGATLLLLAVLGLAVALGVSEGLRKRALDVVFGPEEEFQPITPATASTSDATGGDRDPAKPSIPVASDLGEDPAGRVEDPPRPDDQRRP